MGREKHQESNVSEGRRKFLERGSLQPLNGTERSGKEDRKITGLDSMEVVTDPDKENVKEAHTVVSRRGLKYKGGEEEVWH